MNGKCVKIVQDAVQKNFIVIFTKSYCHYCSKVKKILDKVNDKYTTIELDKRNDEIHLQNALEILTGGRTVPRVFINGAFVGGFTMVDTLYKEGKLQEMVNKEKL